MSFFNPRLIRSAFGMAGMLLAASVSVAIAQTATGDAAAGLKKAKQCATCHGLDGKSKLDEAPNLAGQTDLYLQIALHAYKSGDRKNEMMSLVAANLSDQDIADLAAYYSSLGGAPAAPK
jgi:cytochrome c553